MPHNDGFDYRVVRVPVWAADPVRCAWLLFVLAAATGSYRSCLPCRCRGRAMGSMVPRGAHSAHLTEDLPAELYPFTNDGMRLRRRRRSLSFLMRYTAITPLTLRKTTYLRPSRSSTPDAAFECASATHDCLAANILLAWTARDTNTTPVFTDLFICSSTLINTLAKLEHGLFAFVQNKKVWLFCRDIYAFATAGEHRPRMLVFRIRDDGKTTSVYAHRLLHRLQQILHTPPTLAQNVECVLF